MKSRSSGTDPQDAIDEHVKSTGRGLTRALIRSTFPYSAARMSKLTGIATVSRGDLASGGRDGAESSRGPRRRNACWPALLVEFKYGVDNDYETREQTRKWPRHHSAHGINMVYALVDALVEIT